MRGSALLGFLALMHIHAEAQHFSLLVGPTYGFGAGTIMPKAGAESTNGASGPGWQLGGAYDGLPDSVVHCRVRLAWQRNYWSEKYTSTTYHFNERYLNREPIWNVGTVESRIDQITITPFWVIPIGKRFRALFGADLSLILESKVHNNTRSTFSVPYFNEDGLLSSQLYTDSIGSGIDYMNQYHLAIPVGLEMDLLHHWSISAEFSVGVSKFTNGSPARYARLVLCRKLYD